MDISERIEGAMDRNGRISWKALWEEDSDGYPSPEAMRSAYRRATNKQELEQDLQAFSGAIQQDGKGMKEVVAELGFDPQSFVLKYRTAKSFKVVPKGGEYPAITPDDVARFYDAIASGKCAAPVAPPPKGKYGLSKMYVPSFADIHFNKLCWAFETGENYDLQIASSIFRSIVKHDLQEIGDRVFDRIIVPYGNDLFNADGISGTTTGGTPQDEDTRFMKVFDRVNELYIDAINEFLKHANRVDLVLIRGNHDESVAAFGVEVLRAWFRAEPRIHVDNRLRMRKYFKHGKVLLGLGHMDEDAKQIPMIFASEAKQYFSDCDYYEFHGGHRHTNDVFTVGDLIVRRNPSVTAKDKWHDKKGYIACRQHLSYLFDAETGLDQVWCYTVPTERQVW